MGRLSQWFGTLYTRYQWLWSTTFLLVAVVLAVAAQRQFDENRLAQQWDGWQGPAAVGLVAMVLFGLTTQRVALERADGEPPAIAWERVLPLFLSGVLVAAASVPWFTGNTIRLPGLIILLLGVGLALVALPLGTSKGDRPLSLPWKSSGLSWEWVALLAIVGVGAWLRLHRLDEIPGELTLDQISKFWDVRAILLGERTPIFFEANQGREGLFFYLVALMSQVAGLEFLTIKLTSALIGVASIPAMYLFGKEMAGREVGLLAAFLLAVSKWHIILSRLGYRTILVPLLVMMVMYFLARGLRRGHLLDYGLAGVMLGLGMYSYKSFPFTIPAAVSCAVAYLLRRRRRPLLGAVVMLVLALMVFIPLGVYAVESWDAYVYREKVQTELLRENEVAQGITPFQGYLVNIRKTALMNNFIADPIEIYNPRHERFLGPISATMLILGLGYVLSRITEGRSAVPVIFLLWLIQPVALSMFAPYEYANTLRAAGNIGPVLFIAALSMPVLQRSLTAVVAERLHPVELVVHSGAADGQKDSPLPKKLLIKPAVVVNVVLVLVCLLALGIEVKENYHSVFYVYPSQQRFGGYPLARNIAQEVRDWLGTAPVFIKYSPEGIDIGLVKVYLTSWGVGDVWDPDRPDAVGGYQVSSLALDEPPLSRKDLPVAVFILYPQDAPQDLDVLRQRYPGHVIVHRYRPDGEMAYVVFVGHE
jgi:hypothetical protein